MKLFLKILALVGVLGYSQAEPDCLTPEYYYGSCVTLNSCPALKTMLQTNQENHLAHQYLVGCQQSCGNRFLNKEPVICCTKPARTARSTKTPFFTTEGPKVIVNSAITPKPISFFPSTRGPARRPNAVLPTPPPTLSWDLLPSELSTTRRPMTTTTTVKQTTLSSTAVVGRTCFDSHLRQGVCKPLTSCSTLKSELLTKQNDETFIAYLRLSNYICENAYAVVCCTDEPYSSTSRIDAGPMTSEDAVPRTLPNTTVCGQSVRDFKKIVGGAPSKLGSWPWIVLLAYDTPLADDQFKCGGSLITARHVVTAAHCVREDLRFVRLGEHDLSNPTETHVVDIPVVRTEAHPDYNRRIGRADIAVLYLQRNVKFTNFIRPICLPNTKELRVKSYVNFTPFVAGWGRTMERGAQATVLQELQIPVFDNSVCREAYAKQKNFLAKEQFDNSVLCAGVLTGGKDTCQGDSGGPLMMPEGVDTSNDRSFYLIGVVSYGIGCARPDIPGVYTSTQYFIDWIINKVADT